MCASASFQSSKKSLYAASARTRAASRSAGEIWSCGAPDALVRGSEPLFAVSARCPTLVAVFPEKATTGWEPTPTPASIVGQEFEGYKAVKVGVLCLVDNTHSSAAEFFDDAVVRDVMADHGAMSWYAANLAESTKRNGLVKIIEHVSNRGEYCLTPRPAGGIIPR
jgi:hypothetical protein